jgi:hypothetical protein
MEAWREPQILDLMERLSRLKTELANAVNLAGRKTIFPFL